VNWLFFIWAVNVGRVIETSLGYFMTPLVNVLFGALFLRERLTRWQLASVLLALVGVLNLTLGYGKFPWLAITLCISFGLYGLLRKKSGVRPIPGLFLETTLLTPLAAGYLIYLVGAGHSTLSSASWSFVLLLISTGIVTGLPLVWFGHAARHLRLTTVGFLQYLAPSCSFFLGVFLYHEPFTRAHLITFIFIWVALVIFYRRSHLALALRPRSGDDSGTAGAVRALKPRPRKSQIPSSKSQTSLKIQCRKRSVRDNVLRFGVWDLLGIWGLGFGVWDFCGAGGRYQFGRARLS
jgi:chloramphenicol-sensitive protein RarD